MTSLPASPTKRNSFVHLLQSLRPILSVGGLDCEISQLANAVGSLLFSLHCVEPILILPRLGIMHLVQSSRQVVKSFGLIWIGLDRQFPLRYGRGCFSGTFQISAQEILRVRVLRLKHYDLVQEFCSTIDLIVLPFRKRQEIECTRKVRLQAHGCSQLLARFIVLARFEIEVAEIIMRSGGIRINPRGCCEFVKRCDSIVLVHERNTQVQVGIRGMRLQRNDFPKSFDRLRAATSLCFEHSKRGVSLRAFRVDLDRRPEFLLRLGKIALPRHCQSQVHISRYALLIALDRFSKKTCSFPVFSLVGIQDAQAEIGERELGVDLQRSLKLLYGSVQLSLVLKQRS